MLKTENNQLVSNTIINKLLNTRHVTRQQTETDQSFGNLDIPLGSTYVTTMVSKPSTSYKSAHLCKSWTSF